MRRIRRRLPEHDQITALAAERDAARSELRRLQDHVREHTSLNDSEAREHVEHPVVRNERGEIVDLEAHSEMPSLRRSYDWWPLLRVVGVSISVGVVFGTMVFSYAAFKTRDTIEQKALSRVQSDISELHEYIRHLERDVDYIKSKLTTKTAPIPCTEVSGEARMECLRRDTVESIDKARAIIQQEIGNLQHQYTRALVQGDRTQVDVRARAGDRTIRDPGDSSAE